MYLIPLILLSIVAILFILVPYFRSKNVEQADAPDIAVYKSQLIELSNDIERGLISEDEGKRTRVEIERRLIKASDIGTAVVEVEKPSNILAATFVLIILFSASLYAFFGTPKMPDFPKHLDDIASHEGPEGDRVRETNKMISTVMARLAEVPDEAQGWAYLANLHMSLGNFQTAAEALSTAQNLEPDTFDYNLMYAESLIMASNERVTPSALVILNKAAKMNPEHPGPKYYLGLADYQAGDVEIAHSAWKNVRSELEDNDPLVPLIDFWINKAEVDLGLIEALPQTRAPSITAEQAETIQNMSEGDQQELIRQMVAQLADKQVENPTNIEGWIRLSRAYMVLGQKEQAIEAMKSAIENAPDQQKVILQKELEKLTNLQ